jgi:glycosyltransferase involved in cell wall biosynthesis
MSTFNGGTYLEAQLDSLRRQTLAPNEIIICDDRSTDETVATLQDFAAKTDLPLRFQRNAARLGYARNFSVCATMASGELIAFCDQDDIWEPDKLAVLADAAAGSDALAFSHDLTLVDEEGEANDPSGYFDILAERGFAPDLGCKGCALAVRRSFIGQFGMPPLHSGISHDFWIAFIGTAFGSRLVLRDRLVRHRLHGANTSGWIAQDADRVPDAPSFAETPDVPAEVSQMINVYLKEHSLGWTRPLLYALSGRITREQENRLAPIRRLLAENHAWHVAQAQPVQTVQVP